jgi:thiamine pyrophosphate-dependent acetolactate synthase large subunit-like protein
LRKRLRRRTTVGGLSLRQEDKGVNAPDGAPGGWPDTPVASSTGPLFGSDAIAAMLRRLDVPYLALNPGASYRGLHDSLVNYLGNRAPAMLLCLHEESAVAIAHGYAKVTGRPMGAVLHSNVGLMHASMAIFNAWCDRVPMLLLGATGPVDAAQRRPWIDWIHTASDQGALVRDYTKWDNQPASMAAAFEALLRARQIACTPPCGPTYVNFDAALQEAPLAAMPPLPDPARFTPAAPLQPDDAAIGRIAARLERASQPVILVGRGARDDASWRTRVALAERLQARVITDLKMPAAFPTDHPLHAGPPGVFLTPACIDALRAADVVLALDWYDLAGTLKQALGDAPIDAHVVNVSPDAYVHRGWSMDYQGLAPADEYLMCAPEVVVSALLGRVSQHVPRGTASSAASPPASDALSIRTLADTFNTVVGRRDICLTRVPLGWHGAYRHFRAPLDYIGLEGGGGVGAGPGITVGAALALRGSGRIPVAIMGDGDFLMGVTAIWTAAHYRLPCVIVVANNRSFYNDEVHQERVARARGRPVENKWIGQRIDEPDIDLAAMARAQGAQAFGPIDTLSELAPALERALAAADVGHVAVVDVRVQPGYDANPSGAASPRRAAA